MRYQTIPPALEASCPASVQPASSGLRLLVAVLLEAIAAHQRYERLKRSGLPDATAVRQALFGPGTVDRAKLSGSTTIPLRTQNSTRGEPTHKN